MPGIKGQHRKMTSFQMVQHATQVMLSLGTFTIPQVVRACGLTRDAVSKCVNDLCRTGYVVRHEERVVGAKGSHDVFRLVRMPEPPKLSPADNKRQQAWQSMRIHGTFTIPDVIASSTISRDNASRYLNRLIKAGYIARVRERVSGRAGSCDVFRLVRNTGPQAPVCWDSGQVYDPNNRKVYDDDGEVEPNTCDARHNAP